MLIKFNDQSRAWAHNIDSNIMFVKYVEAHLNDALRVRGYVTLMEVYNYFELRFDIDKYKERRLDELIWLYGRDDKIDITIDQALDDGLILKLNID